MFVHSLAFLAVISIIAAAITFVLYGRARLKEENKKEKMFLRIHYACLFILLLTGMVYMFFMVETGT
ncbi:MAG: hypothetical protein ABIQ88_01125 [Chitinophagaceae bacterium]